MWLFIHVEIKINPFCYQNGHRSISQESGSSWMYLILMVIDQHQLRRWIGDIRQLQTSSIDKWLKHILAKTKLKTFFAEGDIKVHFLERKSLYFFIQISLKYVPNDLICNKPALAQIMAWRRTGAKSLSEPMDCLVWWCIYTSLGLNGLTIGHRLTETWFG